MRLVQLMHFGGERRAALVDDTVLRLLRHATVLDAVRAGLSTDPTGTLNYEPIYRGESDWRLLPPIDHPEPARLLVSGTGLTHLQSAANRSAMHAGAMDGTTATVTDSARMYQLGVEGGKPAEGAIGSPPEWFYKGSGSILRA